ncbi:targeting protein for Xklp2-like [Colletes gigas]|uniref:targeting protein for Xklp2-like n=1 Tax=Colletes gigas TaxID=935657 RepID=UPI001C9A6121|nr:targeting protein for Xklp2-like [Colletes gigas]
MSPKLSMLNEHSTTPLSSVNNLKPSSRKLLLENVLKPNCSDNNWKKHRNSREDKWDVIDAPQFIDFANVPLMRDSFFANTTVIVSTPLPNSTNANFPNSSKEDDMIASFNNIRLSAINSDNKNEENKEEFIVHYTNHDIVSNRNSQESKKKFRKQDSSKRKIKKPEAQKKPVTKPCPLRKSLVPKAPSLQTAIRSLQRKRYDDRLKAKRKEREQMALMESIAKEMREKEEIAQLRKQMTHKAQPVRKYKLGLPQIQKRPLTEPVSPRMLKRRRIDTQNTI